MLEATAASPFGRQDRLRVDRRGRVWFDATFRNRVLANRLLAVRSSVNRRYGLAVVARSGPQGYQRSYLLRRKAGSWRVLLGASRGSENDELCELRRPPTVVALDLGFPDVWQRGCRHKRPRSSLVRRMSAGELASVREMVDWRAVGGDVVPGPVQPRVSDPGVFTSRCYWEGNAASGRAVGEVAKSDPRWGVVDVGCQGETLLGTQLLVHRPATSGRFTSVVAHVRASWSLYGSALCEGARRWPIDAAPRVALRFCAPFPDVLDSVFR